MILPEDPFALRMMVSSFFEYFQCGICIAGYAQASGITRVNVIRIRTALFFYMEGKAFDGLLPFAFFDMILRFYQVRLRQLISPAHMEVV